MENASKALIIAGAILLAILLIGLGVFIYNQASNTVKDTGMDQLEVAKFNEQFEPYINKVITGTTARSLIQTIESSNFVSEPQVYSAGATKADVKMAHTYETIVEYDHGVINKILIKDLDDNVIIGNPDATDYTIILTQEYVNGFFLDFLRNDLKRGEVERLMQRVEDCNKDITTYQDTVGYNVGLVTYDGPKEPEDDKTYTANAIYEKNEYIMTIVVKEN